LDVKASMRTARVLRTCIGTVYAAAIDLEGRARGVRGRLGGVMGDG
jgi:hypothetical protein